MSQVRKVTKLNYETKNVGGLEGLASLFSISKFVDEEVEDFRSRIKNQMQIRSLSPSLEGVIQALETAQISDFEIQEKFPASLEVIVNRIAAQGKSAEAINNLILSAKPAGVGFELKFKYELPPETVDSFGEAVTSEIKPGEYYIIGVSAFGKKVFPYPSDYFMIGTSTFADSKQIQP